MIGIRRWPTISYSTKYDIELFVDTLVYSSGGFHAWFRTILNKSL